MSHLWGVLDLWFILVPVSFFLIFAATYIERIAMSLVGFVLGSYVLFPLLLDKFEPVREWALAKETNYWVSLIIVGIFSAIVLYLLYKIFVFLVGFLASGAMTYFVLDMFFKKFDFFSRLNNFVQENWFAILLGISAVVGIIGGLFASKKSSSIIGILGMICGSFILAVQTIGWIYYLIVKDKEKTIELFSRPAGLVPLVVLTTIILTLSVGISRKTRKKKEKAPDEHLFD